MDTGGQRHGRVDPRQVTAFLRSPEVAQTISPERRAGMDKRVMTAKWSPNERIVYDAVAEGYTSMDSLPVATGLTSTEVREAVARLAGRGAISSVGIEEGQILRRRGSSS